MGIKWRDFQFPRRIAVEEQSYTTTYGKFIAEPFEKGYGVTLGNALRRVLLSSIEGTAVTSIKIDGVSHEFATIKGVAEDLSEIIMNIKGLVLKSFTRTPKKLYIKKNEPGAITAKDIITDESVEIINTGHHIATLTDKVSFNVEMEVGRGRGYVPAELNRREDQPVGIIAIDSIFTPVKKVNFQVETTRVGKRMDYDKLILDIWTNGSIEPKETLIYAGNILSKHFELFINLGELPEEEEVEDLTPEEKSLYEKMKLPVSELELSVRSANCLREANIKMLADLVEKTEPEMLAFRNFGKKSLNEITTLLKSMGLSLGMQLDRKKLERMQK